MAKIPNQNLVGYRVFNGLLPGDLPKSVAVVLDFTQNLSYDVELEVATETGRIPFVQSVFIDNSANIGKLSVTFGESQQTIVCPALYQGYFPVLAPSTKFTASLAGGAKTTQTTICLLSMPMPAATWPTLPATGLDVQLPLGYQQIIGLAAATSLTPPAGARYAVIAVETQAVRYRDDGVAPTAAIGQPLAAGTQNFTYSGDLSAIQFIQQAASATLDITYYA